ncbi:MAG TPA: tandem-95 repeat protein, partial [Hydrogenophaga sp.]|uniref:tandem-95 repeat protein n=1 Tax=Hydrogenophaga sp. TaxID=1904254 RepID=UPI002BB7DD67
MTITAVNGLAVTQGVPITLANGTLTITNVSTGAFTFVPNPDYNGTQTFNYTIRDPRGSTSTANVDITITPVNDAPVAVDDVAETDEDTPVTIAVLANDTDVDGDALTVTSAVAANGTVVINADGTITYTPNADFNGTDTISYEISDGQGGTATATVTVTVNPVNDAPVAVDDVAETDED